MCSQCVNAQLQKKPVCPPLEVEVLSGNVNGLNTKSILAEVKAGLPCFTEIVEKDSASSCAGVFFRDKDIAFYTDRKYIEIGEHFKGKLTPALIGLNRSSLFGMLGYPKLKDSGWDAFQTEYGILVVYYDKAGKINKLQMSSKSVETLKLCE
jgi:hypothetical protein